ncbi:MAG: tRNA (N(6)-L-threonylcarbamoyladenosine(37)-C(2))-methylthiotransferase MtaB [Bacteroidaceae bacterium]|nr:tRNA (N(6)-L-threonylcarbamoyladenosine(37)-C(2))-methylthiotransferase MtaB [Bacteroidaceae bacterium]
MISPLEHKKAAFHTLGCKLNFAETSSLQDELRKRGMKIAQKGEIADLCIINTCSVTDVADSKCRQTIHKFTRQHPGAFVVVMGCYAQLQPDTIAAFEGIDLVVGMEHKGEVIRLIEERWSKKEGLPQGEACHEAIAVPTKDIQTFVPSCSHGDRTRYFLKVQDGCNYYCTYCTIPMARGKSRNGTIESLVKQAQDVATEGGKEIVITGVNIGDFGRSTGETFFDLIKALDKVEGIERYRISSIEPNLLTPEIIDFCASSKKFMPHFHIPLQSGSDEVLKLMRRRYDTALFANRIAYIKQVMPDAFIGVDVIVGMRGETDELFEQAYNFIKNLDISQLHVFTYSERPGTRALEIPHKVDSQTQHKRSQRLLELSEEKRKAHYAKHIGTQRPVLWEHSKKGAPLSGFTDNYIRVTATEGCLAEDNTLSQVTLGTFTEDQETLWAQQA